MLFDTNVVLDLLLRREPWVSQARPLVEMHDTGQIVGYLPVSALTDLFYISRRIVGITRAFEVVDRCLNDFEALALDRALIEAARRLPGNDFEDNVQIACAMMARLDLIVTRNVADFAHSPIPTVGSADVARYLVP